MQTDRENMERAFEQAAKVGAMQLLGATTEEVAGVFDRPAPLMLTLTAEEADTVSDALLTLARLNGDRDALKLSERIALL